MTATIHSNDEIRQALQSEVQELVDWSAGLNEEQFFKSVNEKWSTGEQIEHLRKSSQPLVMALRLPKLVLTLKVGKPNRPSRTFNEEKAKYILKLEEQKITTTQFYPQLDQEQSKNRLLETYLTTSRKLIKVIGKWQETELDNYILPHPLLGKLTVREMLFFTIYHTRHHFEIIKQLYPRG